MSQLPISVVIPAFNCREWIRQAIDSVLAQTARPREIIVVDDGSTDGTAAVLSSYGTAIRSLRQHNQGVAAARNAGLREASGEAIAFLDGDDVWHPRKIELQWRALTGHPEIGLLGTQVFGWPADLPAIGDDPRVEMTRVSREALAVRNYITTSTVLIRRAVVDRVGEFDLSLSGPEDHDYWLRACEVTSAAVLRARLTGYRSVPGSLSRQAAAMEAGMRRILTRLDARDYWRGDRLLRRRAYGYVSFACANLHGAAGDPAAALRHLMNSLAWYPLPLRRVEAGASWVRPRRMAVMLLRLMKLKPPETHG